MVKESKKMEALQNVGKNLAADDVLTTQKTWISNAQFSLKSEGQSTIYYFKSKHNRLFTAQKRLHVSAIGHSHHQAVYKYKMDI
jgi:phage/plasmid-associated DNA primase